MRWMTMMMGIGRKLDRCLQICNGVLDVLYFRNKGDVWNGLK